MVRDVHSYDYMYARVKPSQLPSRAVFWMAAAVVILNLVDALFTLGFIELGAATEANPLMALLLASGPVTFMIGKLTLVSMGVLLLWRYRARRSAICGLVCATTVYIALCIYHMHAANQVATQLALAG